MDQTDIDALAGIKEALERDKGVMEWVREGDPLGVLVAYGPNDPRSKGRPGVDYGPGHTLIDPGDADAELCEALREAALAYYQRRREAFARLLAAYGVDDADEGEGS